MDEHLSQDHELGDKRLAPACRNTVNHIVVAVDELGHERVLPVVQLADLLVLEDEVFYFRPESEEVCTDLGYLRINCRIFAYQPRDRG